MPASMTNLGMDHPQSRSAMRGANPENFEVFINGRAMREPLRMIYIHTVAKRSAGPLSRALFPRLKLAGCENGERYVTCACVPDPIPQASPDQERGGNRIDEHSGWRAVIDLLNPWNLTNDPYLGSQNADFYANRNGTNLIAEGFWPSLNEVPGEEEIALAEKTVKKRYQYLTKEAQRLSAVSTKDLNEFLQLYPDTHIAMDALGLQATWHTANTVTISCPNCGDSIKQGLAFHMSSAGVICILDAQRAFKAGAISKEKFEELQPAKRAGRQASADAS